jgi:hypothetical protein
MRIDDRALRRAEVEEINAIIEAIWAAGDTQTVDKEGLIQGSSGPDAVELLNGGTEWVIYDRFPQSNAVIWHEASITHVAHRGLFNACKKYSPLPTIVPPKDE